VGDLTPKQQRFVDEYLIDLNATQAAIRAGYSKKTAGQIGGQNLKKLQIATAIKQRQEERAEWAGATADDVYRELQLLGFSNMADYVTIGSDGDPYIDLSSLTRDQAAAISEVTVEDFVDGRGEDARKVRRVKFKLADKRGALIEMGKHLGVAERHEHNLTGSLNITHEQALDELDD